MSSLPPDSYTARRLEHATAEHLHQTSLRTFIGPIPEGWLKSHRKQWYRQYLPLGSSDSRQNTFIAAQLHVNGGDDTPAPSSRTNTDEQSEQPAPSSTTEQHQPRTSLEPDRFGVNKLDAPSTRSLLHSRRQSVNEQSPATQDSAPAASAHDDRPTLHPRPSKGLLLDRVPKPRVTFNEASRFQLRARAQRLAAKGNIRSNKIKDGEVMKMDKMLVRIDITQQQLPEHFDEKVSQGVEAKTLDKWREFMLVCRKHTEEDTVAVLQLFKSRVITLNEEGKTKKKPKAQIMLGTRKARVNLYSALDKTLCIWTHENARTTVYYLRATSGATSVEWFTFLNTVLGSQRAQTLTVNVPDLAVTLRLEDPFRANEVSQMYEEAAKGDDAALIKAAAQESGVATSIVARCIDMLKESPDWDDVLKAWAQHGRVGLAWKRYDRLEWVHGAVERKMYGTIAMQKSHDLELRPKLHYPDTATPRGKQEPIKEPTPVEGFLVRLTSQKGQDRRLGKMLFKRLYFATQDHFLLFLRPVHARPPPPPKMRSQANGDVPTTQQITKAVPLTYDVDPYPLDNGRVTWLNSAAIPPQEAAKLDKDASTEAQRNVDMLLASDGFIDLCDVVRVRKMHKGATPADENLDDGPDVDFDIENRDSRPDERTDDGATTEVDEDRTFELLMKNGLVVRLQAYNNAARTEWMSRLRELVTYWSARSKADMDLYKLVREQNLKALQIDERAEAQVGSFAYKWEVSQSFASPVLYNMCGIADCRSIHLSGLLFRKPRRHSTFTRCHVILSHGHLLIYQDTLRKQTGKKLVHIHHERIASIDLTGCYLYSGLLTENDLLYQNRTFDSNTPGHHALPRIYLEDGWTSTDEDAMTTFVIWHSNSKSWFRSSSSVDDVKDSQKASDRQQRGVGGKRTQLKRVSRLGTTGRSVVFKARSRAERDHWVLGIQNEIERLAARNAEGEEVRLET